MKWPILILTVLAVVALCAALGALVTACAAS